MDVARSGICLSSISANPPSVVFSCALMAAVAIAVPVRVRNVRRDMPESSVSDGVLVLAALSFFHAGAYFKLMAFLLQTVSQLPQVMHRV